jgi:hypothetical protein
MLENEEALNISAKSPDIMTLPCRDASHDSGNSRMSERSRMGFSCVRMQRMAGRLGERQPQSNETEAGLPAEFRVHLLAGKESDGSTYPSQYRVISVRVYLRLSKAYAMIDNLC